MDEVERYNGHPEMLRGSPGGFILCILLAPVGVGLIALVIWWLWVRYATLTITDKRAILQTGILFRQTSEVLLRDIREVRILQGPLQRLTNAGTIGIATAATAGVEIQIQGMLDPAGIKAIIDKCRAV